MHTIKRILTAPAFYAIVLWNAYLTLEFINDPSQFNTLLWLYWWQSVLIGVFNFIELITTSNIIPGDFKINNKPVTEVSKNAPWMFLMHYGFFHLVYFIFIAIYNGLQNIYDTFFQMAALCIFLSQLITFVQHKFTYRLHPPMLANLFFLPYLRILPMHLTILLPAFFGWSPSLLFILLRSLLDVVGYIISTPWYWKKSNVV